MLNDVTDALRHPGGNSCLLTPSQYAQGKRPAKAGGRSGDKPDSVVRNRGQAPKGDHFSSLKVTVTVAVVPSPWTRLTVTCWPGFRVISASATACSPVTDCPPIAGMMSPFLIPACAAGPPLSTLETRAPCPPVFATWAPSAARSELVTEP